MRNSDSMYKRKGCIVDGPGDENLPATRAQRAAARYPRNRSIGGTSESPASSRGAVNMENDVPCAMITNNNASHCRDALFGSCQNTAQSLAKVGWWTQWWVGLAASK